MPLGYMVDPDKPGTLKPVPEEVELVKLFFAAFLREKTLTAAAKWLNQQNIKIPRQVRGGGSIRGKVLRFDTVYRILRNKAYLGIRVFQTKGGWEEVPALWDAIIDQTTFDRVQKMLDENCSRRKTHKNKFPFALTGLIHCKECGERLSGASATGGTGKRVGYYEHLATRKKEATINYKLLKHRPRRIPALKIEPFVWDEVKKFILNESFAKELLARAKAMKGESEKETRTKDLENKRNILDRQIATLAERIGKLPESFDPTPLFNQLGEMQNERTNVSSELSHLSERSDQETKTINFESLEMFRFGLKDLIAKGETDLAIRSAITKIIVHKIEILKDGFEIHFHVGEAHYNRALGEQSSSASFFVSKSIKKKKPSGGTSPDDFKFVFNESALKESQASRISLDTGSRRLTDGGPNQSRTGDLSMPWTYDPNFTMGPFLS